MKTIQSILWSICLPAIMLLSCDKGGDSSGSGGGIVGTWTEAEVKGSITFNNTELTNLVKNNFFGEVDDGDTWEFKSNGKCSVGDVTGTYTYKDDKLVMTDEDDNEMTFTATFENNTMALKMKKADAESYAWSVADQIAKAANKTYYNVELTNASITFVLKRKGSSGGNNGGGGLPF